MISTRRVKPSVVYADPPYTADHYSRYYHVLETLILYDFPEVVGKGLYRPDRHVSEFSVKSKVRSSFERLVNAVAQLDADVVISYPDRGLFEGASEIIPEILLNNYRYVSVPLKIDHVHSTMGASKGVQKAPVSEYVFVGRSTK